MVESIETFSLWKLNSIDLSRVAMARLFYHRPQWAILDECKTVLVAIEFQIFEAVWELQAHRQ
jgi:ABC-type uncharacterized transport system fused permease/ATPase subunit